MESHLHDPTAKGLFIVIEGMDGCGKTTFANNLSDVLEATGETVVRTREPGGCYLAEEIRGLLIHDSEEQPMEPETALILFSAARREHLKHRIIPALKQGHIVVCDRFTVSSDAYQVAAQGVDRALFDLVNEHYVDRPHSNTDPRSRHVSRLHPDLGLILSVERDEMRARNQRNPDSADSLDRLTMIDEFYNRMAARYQSYASHPRYRMVDADYSLDVMTKTASAWAYAISMFRQDQRMAEIDDIAAAIERNYEGFFQGPWKGAAYDKQ